MIAMPTNETRAIDRDTIWYEEKGEPKKRCVLPDSSWPFKKSAVDFLLEPAIVLFHIIPAAWFACPEVLFVGPLSLFGPLPFV